MEKRQSRRPSHDQASMKRLLLSMTIPTPGTLRQERPLTEPVQKTPRAETCLAGQDHVAPSRVSLCGGFFVFQVSTWGL